MKTNNIIAVIATAVLLAIGSVVNAQPVNREMAPRPADHRMAMNAPAPAPAEFDAPAPAHFEPAPAPKPALRYRQAPRREPAPRVVPQPAPGRPGDLGRR